MKNQALFSLKNNEKIFMNVVCCSHDGSLWVKIINHCAARNIYLHVQIQMTSSDWDNPSLCMRNLCTKRAARKFLNMNYHY